MKYILSALILLSASHAFTQSKKQGGYFSLRGGLAMKDDFNKGIGHLSVGVSPNHILGIGLGMGFIDFDKPYIPLTVDICFFGQPGKVSPVVIGSAGYGLYNYATPYSTVKGGFTGSLNVGISLPLKKYTKVFFTGGYSVYGFKGGQNVVTSGDSYYKKSDIKMFTISAGFKI